MKKKTRKIRKGKKKKTEVKKLKGKVSVREFGGEVKGES